MARILVVEDDEATSLLIARWLEMAGYTAARSPSIASMFEAVRSQRFDAVVMDLKLGDGDAIKYLEILIKEQPQMRIVVLTAHGSIEVAVEALRRGASGFITKPTSSARLLEEISLLVPQDSPKSTPTAKNFGMIGDSRAMLKVFELMQRVKDVDSTVLIQGETGTGKEVVARALHRQSKRGGERFEAINCAAIPEALLEGELFGYLRGAFTDARQDRKGLFEVCSQGTLLLDEIGELPLGLQAKLLRALQEREIMPLGSQKSVKINTRILAATNRSLAEEVKEGRFRADLYYRLSVIEIQLPPLRERLEDIESLCCSFIKSFSQRFAKELKPLSKDVLARLQAYDWPGNIRELQNALERAVVLCKSEFLTIEDVFPRGIPENQLRPKPDNQAWYPRFGGGAEEIGSLGDERTLFEIHYLKQLLTLTHGNMSLAAQKAGKFRSDLYRLLSKYQIDPAAYRSKRPLPEAP